MTDARLVPCNLLSWPRVRSLLPDQKLILQSLWATARSAAGVWLLEISNFAGYLSLSEAGLEAALQDFKAKGLIEHDQETGEVMILDWFRFHTFKTGPRRRLLKDELARIQSRRLRQAAEQLAAPHLTTKGDES